MFSTFGGPGGCMHCFSLWLGCKVRWNPSWLFNTLCTFKKITSLSLYIYIYCHKPELANMEANFHKFLIEKIVAWKKIQWKFRGVHSGNQEKHGINIFSTPPPDQDIWAMDFFISAQLCTQWTCPSSPAPTVCARWACGTSTRWRERQVMEMSHPTL